MVNTAFTDDTVFKCSPVNYNFTLDGNMFRFVGNHSEVFFLQNCTDEARITFTQYKEISCSATYNETSQYLIAYGQDVSMETLTGKCSRIVSVPYEGNQDYDVQDVLRRGLVLRWTVSDCNNRVQSGGLCGYNMTSLQTQCFCPNGPSRSQICHIKRSMRTIILSVVVGATVGMLILIAVFGYSRRRQSTKKFSFLWSRGRKENQNVETFLKTYSSLAPKRFSYADIKKMTNSFKDKLGEGGYGAVYKGKLHDGRFVAVKVLKKLKGDGEEFINEVASISRMNHVNIITLLGFCFEGEKRALIYDLLSNGSLDKYIHGAAGGQSLTVEIQFNIAVGIARGLDYMHRGCNTRILHFDIKPHNILLDEEFCPKISDFGLAKLCLSKDSSISMLEARGTIGYIAPEVLWRNFGGVSHKSDVYSYGMMVLDMVCGRKTKSAQVQRSSTSELYFPQWIYDQLEVGADISVHEILNDQEKRLQRKMILVSLWCIQMYSSNRPSISRVVEMLEGCLDSLEMPPKPDDASTPPGLIFDFSTTQLTITQLTI